MPSINTSSRVREGILLAFIEAMAVGIPVVSLRTSGTLELLKNSTGILSAEKDALAWQTL